jgi:hypothetical protein
MRPITSEIPSELERELLIALPNSLIKCLKLSSRSKNSPSRYEIAKLTKALYDSPESNVKAKGLAVFGCSLSYFFRISGMISRRAG